MPPLISRGFRGRRDDGPADRVPPGQYVTETHERLGDGLDERRRAATNAIGATHVLRGAGIVMRCPQCDNTLVTIVKADPRMWIDFAGVRTLQVNAPESEDQ